MPTSAVNPNTAQQVQHAVDVKSREDLLKLELQHRNQESNANRQMQLLAMKQQAEEAKATREHQRQLQAEGAQQEKDRYAEYQQFLAGESEKQRTHSMEVINKEIGALDSRMKTEHQREIALSKFHLNMDFANNEAERRLTLIGLQGQREMLQKQLDLQLAMEDMVTNEEDAIKATESTLTGYFTKTKDLYDQIDNMTAVTQRAVTNSVERIMEGSMADLITSIRPFEKHFGSMGDLFNEATNLAGRDFDIMEVYKAMHGDVEVSPEKLQATIREMNDPDSEVVRRIQKTPREGDPEHDQERNRSSWFMRDAENIQPTDELEATAVLLSSILMEASAGVGGSELTDGLAPMINQLLEFEKLKRVGVSEAQQDQWLENFRANLDEGKAFTLHAFLTSVARQMDESVGDADIRLPSGDQSKRGRKNSKVLGEQLRSVARNVGQLHATFQGAAGLGKYPSAAAMEQAEKDLIQAYRDKDPARLTAAAARLPDTIRSKVVDLIAEAIEDREKFEIEGRNLSSQYDELGALSLDTTRSQIESLNEQMEAILAEGITDLDEIGDL